MSLLIDQLIQKWHQIGLEIRAGAGSAALDGFEQRNGVLLPAAMRALYAAADGMDDTGQEIDIVRNIRFWPLSEIRLVSQPDVETPLNYQRVYLFADYLYRSHFYGVSLSTPENEHVLLVADDHPIVVATSFGDFLRIYIDHPENLCGGTRSD